MLSRRFRRSSRTYCPSAAESRSCAGQSCPARTAPARRHRAHGACACMRREVADTGGRGGIMPEIEQDCTWRPREERSRRCPPRASRRRASHSLTIGTPLDRICPARRARASAAGAGARRSGAEAGLRIPRVARHGGSPSPSSPTRALVPPLGPRASGRGARAVREEGRDVSG